MSKIFAVRGWKAVLNVHERVLPVPLDTIGCHLDSLAGDQDQIWPSERWPPMILDRGLVPGSRGGHSLIRYRVSQYLPGRRVEFEFEPMPHLARFAGRHYFEAFRRGGRTILRHIIDVEVDFRTWIYWKVFVEPVHDALIEDAFDKVEVHAGIPQPHRSRWSFYVRFLRWLRSKRR